MGGVEEAEVEVVELQEGEGAVRLGVVEGGQHLPNGCGQRKRRRWKG